MNQDPVLEVVVKATTTALAQRYHLNESGRGAPSVIPIKGTRADVVTVLSRGRFHEEITALGVRNIADLKDLIDQSIETWYERKKLDRPAFYDEGCGHVIGPFKGEFYVRKTK